MKMEKYFKAIFDLTKLPTKFFFLLSAVSGFFLFVDQEFINEKLFLDIAKDRYGWVLGIIFVLCTGLVLVNGYIGGTMPLISVKQCHFKRYCNYIKN